MNWPGMLAVIASTHDALGVVFIALIIGAIGAGAVLAKLDEGLDPRSVGSGDDDRPQRRCPNPKCSAACRWNARFCARCGAVLRGQDGTIG